jgi:hypothetical protein
LLLEWSAAESFLLTEGVGVAAVEPYTPSGTSAATQSLDPLRQKELQLRQQDQKQQKHHLVQQLCWDNQAAQPSAAAVAGNACSSTGQVDDPGSAASDNGAAGADLSGGAAGSVQAADGGPSPSFTRQHQQQPMPGHQGLAATVQGMVVAVCCINSGGCQ